MVEEQVAQSVRRQIGLGRIVPLGDPGDGSWITEAAAAGVLRRAAETAGGVLVEKLRIGLADAGAAAEPVVPAPPSALPPGPLRVTARLRATVERPLPATAEVVRAAVEEAADRRLGLVVQAVDLEVTGLLESEPWRSAGARAGRAEGAGEPSGWAVEGEGPARAAARAALAVPGVARLDPALDSPFPSMTASGVPGVRVADGDQPPSRHVLVQPAVDPAHRALDVARAVRTAVAAAVSADAPGPVTVAVLVTGAGS
ncbi:hypothetical protein [Wenjunlia tyrosinilytica]|uniref:Nucleopolyhedrovirus P10 family protein n=1 Tax=Wenjunlia tyrosinilytica TaxID=1544741 RepID=A0A918DTC5_9ACTN|nr:hypothetical protein [Wenjunlia tyrosinilytica]GGO81239.1 hypothetical protein GCM10012280_04980 [Wenjunlia tyrosinilytica]